MKVTPSQTSVVSLSYEPICFPEEYNKFREKICIDKDNLQAISIRNFLRVIKRSICGLTYEYNLKQIEICRVAVHLGIPYLFNLPAVEEIKQARIYILKYVQDVDDIRLLERGFFDLCSNDVTRFSGYFPTEDTSQVQALAEILSLPNSVIYQVAMIYSLLHADEIPVTPHNHMIEIFARFCSDIQRWAITAKEIEIKVKKKCDNQNQQVEKIPVNEILPL